MLQSALNFIFKKWVVNWAKYQSFWKELNSHCWGKEQGCCSVAKSCLTLWSHGLQHARHPCPSLSPEVCLKSCPLSWWCHLTISSSATLFSFCLQSFLTSGFFFPMSWFFASGGQSMGVSASASVLPMNIQVWFSLGLTSWISFLSKGLSRAFSNSTVQKHQFFGAQPSVWSSSHSWTWHLRKPWLWLCEPLLVKQCLCFLICCLGLSQLFS